MYKRADLMGVQMSARFPAWSLYVASKQAFTGMTTLLVDEATTLAAASSGLFPPK
jgi:hypothetical protein